MKEAKPPPPPNARGGSGPVKLTQVLTITKRIGKGRLGVMYAAVHDVLARRFAVKVLRPALTADDKAGPRLRRIVREASQVEHPNIVPLVDIGQVPDGRYYLTMDYVRGAQLTRLIERDGRFTVAQSVRLLLQLADALDAAHKRRVFHGDLKPNNIMCVEAGAGRELVYIYDWMLSAALGVASGKTDVATHLQAHGTVDYLAPEQLARRSTVDARTDQYAFGAVAYHMLTGQPPFAGEPEQVAEAHSTRDAVPPSRRSGVDDVPGWLDALILRCLEKDPTQRHKSMEQLSRELSRQAGTSATLTGVAALGRIAEPTAEEAEEEEEEEQEVLPESPGKLRSMLYDIALELAQHVTDEGKGSEDLDSQAKALSELREQGAKLSAQVGLTENRFEDIRREMREAESALRYGVIDLNLAKSEALEEDKPAEELAQIDDKINAIEQQLVDLESQRGDRFDALNEELTVRRDELKGLEHQVAIRFRGLHAQLDGLRSKIRTKTARSLFKRVYRCRTALTRKHGPRAGK